MLALDRHQELCRQFAALFSYPTDDVAAQARIVADSVMEASPSAAEALAPFLAFVDENRLTGIMEAYTATFELQALCHPYVGYQLCGENQQRTIFMLRLRDLYNRFGFSANNELPDHFGEVLRFVGTIDDQDCRDELLADGLLPAVEKCLSGPTDDRPYLGLLKALQRFIEETTSASADPDPETAIRQKEYLT